MTNLPDAELEQLLADIRNDNSDAVTRFWELHFDRLSALARRRMTTTARRIYDGEDIALSAINSFLSGLSEQRFRNINNNNELSKLLTTIVVRKISKQQRKQNTQKRGSGQVRGESFFQNGNEKEESNRGLENVSHSSVTPYLEVEFLDTCEQFFNLLEDDKMKNVVKLMIEGYSIDDIAEELGCVRRTVERKLKRIREIWLQQITN
jgi:RNA polymerase sigma factor (sigma-70 family)